MEVLSLFGSSDAAVVIVDESLHVLGLPFSSAASMSISLSRSPRDFSASRVDTSTSDAVGPGSYDPRLPTGAPVAVREESRDDGSIERIQLWKRGAEVPFQSSEGKFAVYSRAIASKTPGPGTYAPECPLGDKAAGYGLKSRSARLAPLAHGSSQFMPSSSVDNPGPGSYFDDATATDAGTSRRSQPPLRIPNERSAATIPLRRLRPGESSTVEETAIPMMEYTGDKADTCGPAHYSIESARRLTAPAVRNAQWHKYREERKVFQPSHTVENTQPDPVVPGPGQYHLMNYNNRKLPPLGTSQFRSRVPMAHQIIPPSEGSFYDYDTSTAANTVTSGSLSTSSADLGHCGHFNAARVAIESHKAAVAPFSSSVPRSDAWARTVEAPFTTPHTAGPGPGSYRHQASSSSKDGVTVLARECVANTGGDSYTTRTIRHKLNAVEGVHVRRSGDPVVALGEHRRYYGVHNPLHVAIVSEALDNRQPISAFDSTDGRPCNKPLPQGTPGPDQYATGEALSISKFVSAKAAVGRKGVFGTCASRYAGSAFAERNTTVKSHCKHEEERSPRATAAAVGRRKGVAPQLRLVRDNSMRRTVRKQTPKTQGPGPAAYSPRLLEDLTYSNPTYRNPKQHHLSFGSGKDRFGGSGGVFCTADHAPGPGQYSARDDRGLAVADTRSKRFGTGVVGVDYTAITSTDGEVGPGSYEPSGGTVAGVKSHNVTMNIPWSELSSKRATNSSSSSSRIGRLRCRRGHRR